MIFARKIFFFHYFWGECPLLAPPHLLCLTVDTTYDFCSMRQFHQLLLLSRGVARNLFWGYIRFLGV